MEDITQKKLDALFREVAVVKKIGEDQAALMKDLHEKIDPIVKIYETWTTIGKWSRPFLVALSLIVAIFTGIITLVGAIKGHLK